MKPFLWGVPLLGVFGFLLASIFGMWLVFNILGVGTEQTMQIFRLDALIFKIITPN
jgi:hypothetical protein